MRLALATHLTWVADRLGLVKYGRFVRGGWLSRRYHARKEQSAVAVFGLVHASHLRCGVAKAKC